MFKKIVTLLNKKNRGFTLIEVVIVIGILSVLAVLGVPALAGYMENSKAATNVSNAKLLYNAATAYLASTPSAAASDIDGADSGVLVTNNYLGALPKTAEGRGFTLVATGDVLSVTWTKETSKDTEGGSGVAKGATATYPF